MHRGLTGHYVPISTVGEHAKAFVPHPLPPVPPVYVDGELGTLLDAASTALGRLDGISSLLPDPRLFLYTYIRKEAVLSSQIETSREAVSSARRLLDLFQADRLRLQSEAASVLRLHEVFQNHPVLSANAAAELIKASQPTVNMAFKKLTALGLVHEITGGNYGRLYAYTHYLEILNEDGEPLV